MLSAFKLGILLGFSIIISIGAQNLFVIKQGLRNEYPYLSAFTCFLCDLFLIILGVTGMATLVIQFPILKNIMLILGIIFLSVYGSLSLKRSFNINVISKSLQELRKQTDEHVSITKLILSALSFSVLNPQAILDTMVIIGGNANHYADAFKFHFVLGTISASFIWFFSLAGSASYFSNKMMNITCWRVLDLISGVIMLVFAIQFTFQLF